MRVVGFRQNGKKKKMKGEKPETFPKKKRSRQKQFLLVLQFVFHELLNAVLSAQHAFSNY